MISYTEAESCRCVFITKFRAMGAHWLFCTALSVPPTIGARCESSLRLPTKSFPSISATMGAHRHSSTMNYEVMTEDLREFLAEQGLSEVFLLGHSMGGKVAMQFASESPEAI